jgi:hypothetical protein
MKTMLRTMIYNVSCHHSPCAVGAALLRHRLRWRTGASWPPSPQTTRGNGTAGVRGDETACAWEDRTASAVHGGRDGLHTADWSAHGRMGRPGHGVTLFLCFNNVFVPNHVCDNFVLIFFCCFFSQLFMLLFAMGSIVNFV